MSDIVAQLEVLSQEGGCVVDISAIIDNSICPKVDVKTHKPHKVEEKDDYICVIPTEEEHETKKRCDKKTCYEVREEVCRKNTVALDSQILVLLGLLTEGDLEKYLRTTGAIGDDEALGLIDGEWAKNVKLDPFLSAIGDEGDNNFDWVADEEDGLVTLDRLAQEDAWNAGDKKGGGPLDGLLGGAGGLLGGGGLLGRNADNGPLDGLLGVAGGLLGGGGGLLGRNAENGPLDGLLGGVGGLLGGGGLLGRSADSDNDNDAFTHPRMFRRRLLDLDIGGERDDEDRADIDLDLFTHGPDRNNGGIVPVGIIPGKPTTRPYYPSLITHYQPICSKGFRKAHRDGAEKCHAEDVNHCLAICSSKSALVTIGVDAQVGDVANIQLCAAIVFDKSADGDNCHYFVAPETEPCHEEELEEDENCVAFIRN